MKPLVSQGCRPSQSPRFKNEGQRQENPKPETSYADTMKRIAFASIAGLTAATLLWACQDRGSSDEPSSQSEAVEVAPTESPTYPRLYEQGFDKGREVEGLSPIELPLPAKVVAVMEDRFRAHLESFDADKASSFGIDRSRSESLRIHFAPSSADSSREMTAVWTQTLPAEATTRRVVRRSAQPLADDGAALALLRAYALEEGDLETMIEWAGD